MLSSSSSENSLGEEFECQDVPNANNSGLGLLPPSSGISDLVSNQQILTEMSKRFEIPTKLLKSYLKEGRSNYMCATYYLLM